MSSQETGDSVVASPTGARAMPNRGRRLGRLIVTTVRQAGGHPWIDQAVTDDAEGHRYSAVAVRPSLRRQTSRRGGRALVVGWRR